MTLQVSQADAILMLLQTRPQGITALDAFREVGSLRLAARIADLRAAGNEIVTRDETTPTGKRIARYVLVPPRQPSLGL